MGKKQELSPKRARFVSEYLIDQNGTQAAIRAGYSPKTANEQAARLLANASVRAAVDENIRKIHEKNLVTPDRIIQELARIAFANISLAFNKDGDLKPIHEIPEDIIRAIGGLEISEIFSGSGDDRTQIGVLKKIKMNDKQRALELLGKNLGMFVERHQVEGSGFILRQMIPEKSK